MNKIDCHVCLHTQGFYGNTFLWLFNLHKDFASAPLRPRFTVKTITEDGEYSNDRENGAFFHFRPDDYHRWFIRDMSWEEHVKNVLEEQAIVEWRDKTPFTKLIVKPQTHSPQRFVKQGHHKLISTDVIYHLSTPKENTTFYEKIARRLMVLNSVDESEYDEILKNTIEQKDRSDLAITEIKQLHTVVEVDVDKLLFKYDQSEYEKVLKHLGTEPLHNWKKKLTYAKETINEE
jgi:hypothetical protein|tara:strand:+ start:2184 stop:2882 length:699 start_codon:yes stop_codon:yes gene_type:complete